MGPWPIYVFYDPGFDHPCAVLWIAVAPNGTYYVMDEVYGGGMEIPQVAKAIHEHNAGAYIERFIQSIQQERLEKFVVVGRQHMDCLVSEYVEHYNHERPHQAKGNRPLIGDTLVIRAEGEVICRERLGGGAQTLLPSRGMILVRFQN